MRIGDRAKRRGRQCEGIKEKWRFGGSSRWLLSPGPGVTSIFEHNSCASELRLNLLSE